jgi:hypothetical protein
MINAKCIGGPYDGKMVTQKNNCYEFIVNDIDMGKETPIGKYVRYTEEAFENRYIEWHFKKLKEI